MGIAELARERALVIRVALTRVRDFGLPAASTCQRWGG